MPTDVDSDRKSNQSQPVTLNPEVIQRERLLPGIEELKIISFTTDPRWVRWTEGIALHFVSAGLVAGITLAISAYVYSAPADADTPASDVAQCTTPLIEVRNLH